MAGISAAFLNERHQEAKQKRHSSNRNNRQDSHRHNYPHGRMALPVAGAVPCLLGLDNSRS
jgi:hypothetical protein